MRLRLRLRAERRVDLPVGVVVPGVLGEGAAPVRKDKVRVRARDLRFARVRVPIRAGHDRDVLVRLLVLGPDRVEAGGDAASADDAILEAHGEQKLERALVHGHDLPRGCLKRVLDATVRVRLRERLQQQTGGASATGRCGAPNERFVRIGGNSGTVGSVRAAIMGVLGRHHESVERVPQHDEGAASTDSRSQKHAMSVQSRSRCQKRAQAFTPDLRPSHAWGSVPDPGRRARRGRSYARCEDRG